MLDNAFELEDIQNINNGDDRIRIARVRIKCLREVIGFIVRTLMDTSWITKLQKFRKKGLEAAARPTIDYIEKICKRMLEIPQEDTNILNIKREFGEYAVSLSALNALEELYNHKALPLCELIKEKKSNNHGFDYITLDENQYFVFGEAKYRAKGNGDKDALIQVVDFITKEQHYIDSNFVAFFNENAALQCSVGNKYGISIASNVDNKALERRAKRLRKNEAFKQLSGVKNIYIIYIENENIF